MGITVTKLASNRAKVALMFGEDTINIEYMPSKITEKVFADMQALASGMDAESTDMNTIANSVSGMAAAMNDLLVQLVAIWDVFEDDAQTIMFPLDATRLPELPLMFRLKAIMAVFEDTRGEAAAAN